MPMQKPHRNRLIKAEVHLLLAVSAERWADQVAQPEVPIEQWAPDDPMVSILNRYDVTPKELAGLVRKVASAEETKAHSLGINDIPT